MTATPEQIAAAAAAQLAWYTAAATEFDIDALKDGGWRAWAAPLDAVRALKAALTEYERLLENEVAVAMGAREARGALVADVGVVSRARTAPKKKWDGKHCALDLARRTAARLVDDASVFFDDQGDRRPLAATAERIAVETANEVVACAGLDAASKAWKSTELKKRGLDPDDYMDKEQGRYKVEIVGGVDATEGANNG